MSILFYSEAIGSESSGRIDAGFFEKRHIAFRKKSNTWSELNNLAQSVTCGPFGSNLLNDNYVDTGIPMIRPFNLRAGRADAGDIALLEESFINTATLKLFGMGTLMFARVGDIGVGISTFPKATISLNIIAVELSSELNPFFATIFFNTTYGLSQLSAGVKAVAQPTISTSAIRGLRIFSPRKELQEEVAALFQQAIGLTDKGKLTYSTAENLLLNTLGLTQFKPSPEAINIKSFKDSFGTSGRIDAEYYQPKYEALLDVLKRDGLTIADVATVRNERFKPQAKGHFDYIEIGSLNGDGTVTAENIEQIAAPSRASQFVRAGDIVTSTVRPIRGLTGLIDPKQDGSVCSSGFVVLAPQTIAAEVLLVFLRLPLICELLDLQTSATMYPAIAEKDLLAIPIQKIANTVQAQIVALVQEGYKLKTEGERLLEVAKLAVEIAIEQDEQAGLNYIKKESHGKG